MALKEERFETLKKFALSRFDEFKKFYESILLPYMSSDHHHFWTISSRGNFRNELRRCESLDEIFDLVEGSYFPDKLKDLSIVLLAFWLHIEKQVSLLDCLDVANILLDPDLFNLITIREFDKKIVGEFEARQTIFLVTCMRLVLNRNKASCNLVVNAPSGCGKDYLTSAIFQIIPDEEKEELIRISPKVLAYTRNRKFDPNASWRKCCLRLEDVSNSVLNDESFKVMLSADPSGINRTKVVWKGKVIEYEILGKPAIVMTIADPNPKEEMLRRVPFLYLNEGIDQTKEILKRQAEFARKGLSFDYDDKIRLALKCLDEVKVKIPYADKLIDLFNPQEVIVRTFFPRFLDYIKASCALYQYQREMDEEGYLIAEPQDYDIARIALMKTTSNVFMIPLTKLQKDLLEIFKSKNLQRQSIDDLFTLKEIQRLGRTPEWIRKQLDFLVSKGFLIKDRERRTDESGRIIPKPVFVYSYNPVQSLYIPTWDELDQISSNTLINKNTSISSNTSNTQVNEVIEVNERQTYISNNEEKPEIERIEDEPTKEPATYKALKDFSLTLENKRGESIEISAKEGEELNLNHLSQQSLDLLIDSNLVFPLIKPAIVENGNDN